MNLNELLAAELKRLEDSQTVKYETAVQSAQGGVVKVQGKEAVMLASNNYLGMSNHPVVCKAAIDGIKKYGYGLASVRFLTGTQTIHLELEKIISKFVQSEDTILALVKRFPNLTVLHVRYSTISSETLLEIAKYASNLKTFVFKGHELTGNVSQQLLSILTIV